MWRRWTIRWLLISICAFTESNTLRRVLQMDRTLTRLSISCWISSWRGWNAAWTSPGSLTARSESTATQKQTCQRAPKRANVPAEIPRSLLFTCGGRPNTAACIGATHTHTDVYFRWRHRAQIYFALTFCNCQTRAKCILIVISQIIFSGILSYMHESCVWLQMHFLLLLHISGKDVCFFCWWCTPDSLMNVKMWLLSSTK